ncbi:hypothetical protein F5Y15DRAFT_234577 [Xylariaceae sp. FL0016]|nr:hypothetical protein F5Y15DRAFT_234577 [Xylariaceae sp. FL0016]
MAAVDVQLPQTAQAIPSLVTDGLGSLGTSSNDVDAVLNFFKDNEDGSPPLPTYVDRPETYDRPVNPQVVRVTDISGRETAFTLDKQGFQVFRHVAQEKDFLDDEHIKAVYYPETEQLLKDVTGASKIFIFDHTIRRPHPASSSSSSASDEDAAQARAPLRGPVQRVHIDQSYDASRGRVAHHLPAPEAASLLRGRVQIINVWRPIGRPVTRDPLAVADARSVPEADLVPIGLVYPDRRGETYAVRWSAGQRWYYRRGLGPDEVLLIKCFDSKTDGRARRVPHSAFVDPRDGVEGPARESIEVRCLVFHPEDRD